MQSLHIITNKSSVKKKKKERKASSEISEIYVHKSSYDTEDL